MNKVIFPAISMLILTATAAIGLNSCKVRTTQTVDLMDSIRYEKSMPEWAKNSNIYEVNTRQYTPEGTFKAFGKQLPRLKAMGVDIIWLMPINPIGQKNRKGTLGSYYSIQNYKEINPEFGTKKDFKELVAEAHKLGMHVIIDWVANHTAWDNVWVKSHPDWYTRDSNGNMMIPAGTDWKDAADLNYDKPALRKAMIDAMSYWIKYADIDGFRCDVAFMIPVNFWMHARRAIDELKPNCFFLAEAGDPLQHKAFDMTYDWPLKDVINDMAKGKKNVTDLVKLLNEEQKKFSPKDLRMQFITNHDINTWDGSEYERLGKAPVDAFTVLTYTIPGMPLIYTGQEEPISKRLRFFDKDTVGFNKFEKKGFYTKLNQLKKENKALWNITYGGNFKIMRNSNPENILTFTRLKEENSVLCLFNFSGKEQSFKILDITPENISNYLGEKLTVTKDSTYKLKAWGYSVFVSGK
jgi:glycosidase